MPVDDAVLDGQLRIRFWLWDPEGSVDVDDASLDGQLRIRWEIYLVAGNSHPLLVFLGQYPQAAARCAHAYPYEHRITDVVLGDRAYRVGRCVLCNERLTFAPIALEVACPGETGVPYRLQGGALRNWVTQREKAAQSLDRECIGRLSGKGLDCVLSQVFGRAGHEEECERWPRGE
jgi:hypothetical protein